MTYADYAAALATLAEQIKNDKDIVQPQRNYAAKLVVELQAMLMLGLTTTNRKPDEPAPMEFAAPPQSQCMCTPGMPARKDCPIHGRKA